IIGGNVATNGHWPWLAAVRREHDGGVLTCTGSLIAKEFVITAGHCVREAVAEHLKDFNITVGSVDFNQGGQIHTDEIFLHPNFSISGGDVIDTWRDDIAILKLAKPVKYGPLVQSICLPSAFEETPGELAAVAGWGWHDERDPDGKLNLTCADRNPWFPEPCPDDNLARENMVPLRSFKICNDTVFGPNDEENQGVYPFTNPERFICAGGKDEGVSHGDSGGPLMINRKGVWYLIGSTDLGDNKPAQQDRFPGKEARKARSFNPILDWYVRVSSYCPWIEKVTGGKAKCRKIA
ncbi:serine protease, partial [Aphelenchoides avenae]